MGLPDLDGSGHLTCEAGQVSMRFVWFGVFEICVLKFWELELGVLAHGRTGTSY